MMAEQKNELGPGGSVQLLNAFVFQPFSLIGRFRGSPPGPLF